MKKSISPTTFNVLSLIVLSFALLNGCSDNTGLGNGPPPPSPDQTETLKDEAIREMAKVKPSPELLNAVKQFQEEDVDASFSWLNGHVDNFATSAKETVPEYALPILKDLGLPTEPKKPLRLPDPTYAKELEKPGNTLDDDFKERLPYVTERQRTQEASEGKDDQEDESRQGPPKEEIRTDPAKNQERMIKWDRPDDKTLSLERKAAEPILKAFLKEYQAVFEVNADQFKGGMQFQDFQHGAYFKKAVYQQAYGVGENVLYGKTLVHFDVNWNVIGISRMIVTQEKLKIPTTEKQISRQKASEIAMEAFDKCTAEKKEMVRAEKAVDLVRGMRVWDVEYVGGGGQCHWRTIIDPATGTVLNVSDLISRYTDAELNRWYFSGGDLKNPRQIVSTGQYTRNDRRLEHDFFYVMNDHRCEGDPESNCSDTPHGGDTWCDEAHGSYNGSSYIRATRRSNRDFSEYYPGGSSESFGETNAYYWARWFSQWLKPSLDAMGVLPSSASDYTRVLIITNACTDNRSYHSSSYQVTTDDNKGEGGSVIRLGHRDPSGSSTHNYGCEGGGCFDNPSNLDHEMNHFFLKKYYGIGSDLDCGGSNQLQFTHEGMIGTAVPQAYWHNYYGIGYNPSSTDKLYFSHSDVGRVHTSNSNLITLSDYLCVDSTDDPYEAGRVAGQALWKFYHGKKVNGSAITSTWYPTTDTDFNVLVYWAADLQSASTYKDRYEYANRLMEILDKHSNWSSSGKQDYCDIFDTHELDTFIDPDYCN